MHIVIGGAGETGIFIAEELSKKDLEDNYSVTVIDDNYSKIQKLNQQFNVATLCGSIVDLPILKEAIRKETKAFVACTPDEETNLISCILAHNIGAEKSIAVTTSSIYTKKKLVEKYNKSGIERIINITEVLCDEVINLAKFSLATQISSFVEGKVVMFGLIVTEESSFVDKFLHQIPKDSFFLIGCVYRDGKSYIPRGDWKIQKNDQLFVLLPKEKLQSFKEQFDAKTAHQKTAVIYGSSLLNSILVNSLLQENFKLTVICDSQEEKAILDKNTSSSKKLKIIVGPILDLEFQKKAQVSKNFLFIAISDNELYNINACMIAKFLGAKKTIAIVHKSELLPVAQIVKIDVSLSERVIVNRLVQQFIHYGNYSPDFTTITNTSMEVLSLTITKDSTWKNKTLKEIELPKNSLVGVLIDREGKVIIPKGETVIKVNNRILFFTLPENLPFLKKKASGA